MSFLIKCRKRRNLQAALPVWATIFMACLAQIQSAHAAACPVSNLPVMPTLPPSASGGAGSAPPPITFASSVKPSDTSTSIVIHPDPSMQINCGKVPVSTHDNVIYDTVMEPDGAMRHLAMDILVPETPGKKPLVVYIPGGGFLIAFKESALDQRTFVAESGFVVASIQYRTLPDHATYKDGLADVKSAIRYLRTHAGKYDIDPSRVAVWGQSAGGYFAAMAGVTGNTRKFDVGHDLDQSSAVQAVVDQFGPSDVSKIGSDFDEKTEKADTMPGPVSAYVGGFSAGGGALQDQGANPLSYVAASDPPFLLMHGSQDKLVSPSQTLLLDQALLGVGVKSTRYVLAGANHGDLSFMGDKTSGLPWSSTQTMDIIVGFLRANLAK